MENSKRNIVATTAVNVLATIHLVATLTQTACMKAEHKIVGGDYKEVASERMVSSFAKQDKIIQRVKDLKQKIADAKAKVANVGKKEALAAS